MAKAVYNISGMKSAAGSIRDKMESFKSSKNTMNTTVENTKQFWQDDRQTKYIEKYQDLKDSMDKVEDCMKAYAEFLEAAAKHFDIDQRQGI